MNDRIKKMQWFIKLKVATKPNMSFGIVLALTTGLGDPSIIQLDSVNRTSTDIDTLRHQ
jgi:hypothetical protein